MKLAVGFILIVLVVCLFSQTEPRNVARYLRKYEQSGMTFTNGKYCPNVTFGTSKAMDSLYHLYTTGANSISIIVTQYQEKFNSTQIFPIYVPYHTPQYTYLTATMEDLETIIRGCHKFGLYVMLKPQIDLIDDPQHWRGDIGTNFTADQWIAWFHTYTNMLMPYVELCERLKVEQISVSCELITASEQDKHWRQLISLIRKSYTGVLTSAANWGYLNATGGEITNKTWWDAVDLIGCDAYYPILNGVPDPTIGELLEAWDPIVNQLYNLSVFWNRSVILTEIGYCSGDCSHISPANSTGLLNQALHYEAVLEKFQVAEWFKGVYWWNWVTDASYGAHFGDSCLPPQYKPSELVLRKYYKAVEPIPDKPTYPTECICTM